MLQVQTQRSQQVACNTIDMPQPTCPLMGLLTLVPVSHVGAASRQCALTWSLLPGHHLCFTLLLVLQVTMAMEEGWLVHAAMYVRQGVNPSR